MTGAYPPSLKPPCFKHNQPVYVYYLAVVLLGGAKNGATLNYGVNGWEVVWFLLLLHLFSAANFRRESPKLFITPPRHEQPGSYRLYVALCNIWPICRSAFGLEHCFLQLRITRHGGHVALKHSLSAPCILHQHNPRFACRCHMASELGAACSILACLYMRSPFYDNDRPFSVCQHISGYSR